MRSCQSEPTAKGLFVCVKRQARMIEVALRERFDNLLVVHRRVNGRDLGRKTGSLKDQTPKSALKRW
jgi:hypothetical protein